MSRGHGSVQREVLQAVAEAPDGYLVLVGDGGWGYRRAAHKLASEGLVSLVMVNRYGRNRLAVRRLTVLDRLREARAHRQQA